MPEPRSRNGTKNKCRVIAPASECQREPRGFREKSLLPERTNACDSTRLSANVQVLKGYVIACSMLKKGNLANEGREKTSNRGYVQALSFVVELKRKGNLANEGGTEDFESRPHQALSLEWRMVERGKEMQEWNELKLPKAFFGYSRGGCQEGAQKRKAEKKERWKRHE